MGGSLLVSAQLGATAQILGPQTPGTPGAIDGELRSAPGRAPIIAPDPRLAPQGPAGQKFGIKKNPNIATRRSAPERGNGNFPGASPMGQTRSPSTQPPLRVPGRLPGVREPAGPDDSLPPLGRPSLEANAPPGLPPITAPQRRRPALEEDPYAPLGIKAGTMLLRPAIAIEGGYDTNATRSGTNRRASPLYRTEAELKANSDWSAHRFDLDLRGAYAGYTAISNANRPEGDLRAALRLDATRDLTIDAELRARIETESASSVNLPGGVAGRTPYYSETATLGATQRFGRLSLGLRGNLDRTDYADAKANGGGTIDQSSRNFTGYGLRLRAGYELTPGISPFAEIGADQRRYDQAFDGAGYRRSSDGATMRLGTTFELARNLTGEAALGYTFRAYEDARLAHMKSPLLDAQLTWSISPLTTLNVRAQSEIAETTIAGSSGAKAYRANTTLTHAFLRNFTATATLGYGLVDYDRVSREEKSLNAGLRLEYKFNRLLALRGSYAFESTRVNAPGESYNAQTFLLGMRVTP